MGGLSGMPAAPATPEPGPFSGACLVVDWGERVFAARLVDEAGRVFPCVAVEGETVRRYFETSVWLEPGGGLAVPGGADFPESVRAFFRRGARDPRDIGWMHAWEVGRKQEAVPALDFMEIPAPPGEARPGRLSRMVRQTAAAMARFVLEPLFQFAALHGPAADGVPVLLAVPGRWSRRSRLILRKIFMENGFGEVQTIDRTVAAALGGLADPGPRAVVSVLDMQGSRSFLHDFRRDIGAGAVHVECRACRELPALGREGLVRRFQEALREAAFFRGERDSWNATERLLSGLLGFGCRPPEGLGPLTRNGLGELFAGRIAPRLGLPAADGAGREQIVSAPGDLVPLGELFVFSPLERYMLDRLGFRLAPGAFDQAAPDRVVRALTEAVGWKRRYPAGRLTVRKNPSLRIETLPGQAETLVGPEALPRPGEKRVVRQNLSLGQAPGAGPGRLRLVFRFGAEPHPWACAPAALAELPVSEADLRAGRPIGLEMHLARSAGGERLSGRVEATLGSARAVAPLDLPETFWRL